MKKRPVLVTILALVMIAAGAVGLVYHAMDFHKDSLPWYAAIEALRVVAIVAGVFMLRGRNWARWLTLSWLAFHVAISVNSMEHLVVHVALFAVYVVVLFLPSSREYFR